MTSPVTVSDEDIGWATSAAQHLCHPADRDAAIRLLASSFARRARQACLAALDEAAEWIRAEEESVRKAAAENEMPVNAWAGINTLRKCFEAHFHPDKETPA